VAEQRGRPQVRVPGEDRNRQRGRYPAASWARSLAWRIWLATIYDTDSNK